MEKLMKEIIVETETFSFDKWIKIISSVITFMVIEAKRLRNKNDFMYFHTKLMLSRSINSNRFNDINSIIFIIFYQLISLK